MAVTRGEAWCTLSRRSAWMVGVLLTATLTLVTSSARAWDFSEHRNIGRASPEELESDRQRAAAVDDLSYLNLARLNVDHFHRDSVFAWEKYHAAAYAMTNASSEYSLQTRLTKALYREAFAQHFLQDSFAAGHMGFNRAASSLVASKSFHDEFNKSGRSIRLADGTVCRVTRGDGRLEDRLMGEGSCDGKGRGSAVTSYRTAIGQAATASVEGFLSMAVLGVPDGESDARTRTLIPAMIAPGPCHAPDCVPTLFQKCPPRPRLTPECEGEPTESLLLVRAPAQSAMLWGLGSSAVVNSGLSFVTGDFNFAFNEPLRLPLVKQLYLLETIGIGKRWDDRHSIFAALASLRLVASTYMSHNGIVLIGPWAGGDWFIANSGGPAAGLSMRLDLGGFACRVDIGAVRIFGALPGAFAGMISVALLGTLGGRGGEQFNGPSPGL